MYRIEFRGSTRSAVGRVWPLVALAGAASAWGSTFAVNKVALAEVGPFTILAARFPLALAVLLAVASRRVRLAGLVRPRLLLFGVPLAVHFATQTAGLAFTTASRGALIVAGIPVTTAGVAALALRERVTFRVLAGITLSVLGLSCCWAHPTQRCPAGCSATCW